MSEVISRKLFVGERAMVAQVFLDKDAVVPLHQHENEQITYILKGALKLRPEHGANIHSLLLRAYQTRAKALVAQKQFAQALHDYDTASAFAADDTIDHRVRRDRQQRQVEELVGASGEGEPHQLDRMRADIDADQWFRASEPHRPESPGLAVVRSEKQPMLYAVAAGYLKGRAYILMIQRDKFGTPGYRNGDDTAVRKDFQQAAADALNKS